MERRRGAAYVPLNAGDRPTFEETDNTMSGRQEWRRVGLLVPSSNTVMEVDFYRRLPSSVTVHTGRMFMEDTTAEGESRMLDEFTKPAAEALATARPDVVVFGCTSAGALRGNAYDDELCDRIAGVTGATAVSVIRSVREAIARRSGTRIGVVTPYVEELNVKIRDSIEDSGDVDVVDIVGLGLDENFTIAEVEPAEIVRFAVDTFSNRDIDLLFASCTNFRAVDALADLEAALDVPVVTSNQAALEAVGRLLDRLPTFAGLPD